MQQTKKKLLFLFWGIWLLAGGVILAFETGLAPTGSCSGDKVTEFFLSVVLILTTMMVFPLALYLFKWKRVKSDINTKKEKAILFWGRVRMLILAFPLLASLVLYYLFMQPAFCYLAIVLGLCLFMVYPSSYQYAKDASSINEK